MLNINKNFVFVHCQKAAGTSISQALCVKEDYEASFRTLGPPWDGPASEDGGCRQNWLYWQHASANQYKSVLGQEMWNNLFTFSFVRNPWDRYISWIKFEDNEQLEKGIQPPKDIDHQRLFQRILHSRHSGQGAYCDMLFDKDGELLVDFVGKFENLQDDFNVICDKIDRPRFKLFHKNKTSHRPYWEYYDQKSIDLVYRMHHRDIEYFGYTFGN